jgi:hypothetical protein
MSGRYAVPERFISQCKVSALDIKGRQRSHCIRNSFAVAEVLADFEALVGILQRGIEVAICHRKHRERIERESRFAKIREAAV